MGFRRGEIDHGEMAEWSIAAVLKTVELRGSGGSNPSLSAEKQRVQITSDLHPFYISLWRRYHSNQILLPLKTLLSFIILIAIVVVIFLFILFKLRRFFTIAIIIALLVTSYVSDRKVLFIIAGIIIAKAM